MRQILDLIPLILFFIAYKMDGQSLELLGYSHTFDGIFSATAVLMIASTVQVAMIKLLTGTVEKQLLWLFAVVVVAGSATLILRNELFIQWKPTVFNWGMATVLFASLFIGKKSLLERMLGQQLQLPKSAWLRLNQLWIINFTVVGALNIYVAYNFSQSAWVDYKLYSAIGFTLLLMILTMVIIFPHIKDQPDDAN
ncbi:MAG: intracellular septation protein A [Cellvibrionales bacterium]|nr:intracellular septation protein A [Cellvibrionales bacterium]|tara:strand:- start:19694 stop:20281 length:588 start_codon:yes stop_codon:yes gene_type:complete